MKLMFCSKHYIAEMHQNPGNYHWFFSVLNFETITLFIFLAQFLVTTKIKAKKLVTTKIFGRDQFFCLNFGRDQKLGEENEKG